MAKVVEQNAISLSLHSGKKKWHKNGRLKERGGVWMWEEGAAAVYRLFLFLLLFLLYASISFFSLLSRSARP